MIGGPSFGNVSLVRSPASTEEQVPAQGASARTNPLAEFFLQPATRTYQAVTVDADADAETVFQTIKDADLAASPPVRALTLLRAVPDRIVRRVRRLPPQPAARRTIEGLIEGGWWVQLVDRPPAALALGLVMWDDRVHREGQTRRLFDDPAEGAVRVGWELRVQPISDGRSLLITETMTEPIGEAARRRFHRYWSVISPFAGLTRRQVINRIGRVAERRPAVSKVTA
jgi:hypothetical protein